MVMEIWWHFNINYLGHKLCVGGYKSQKFHRIQLLVKCFPYEFFYFTCNSPAAMLIWKEDSASECRIWFTSQPRRKRKRARPLSLLHQDARVFSKAWPRLIAPESLAEYAHAMAHGCILISSLFWDVSHEEIVWIHLWCLQRVYPFLNLRKYPEF